jgi:asparagine synthase (glutamine-hydrolysing)
MSEPRKSRFRIRSKLRRMFGQSSAEPLIPAWLDESFASRTNLHDRWKEYLTSPVDRTNRRPSATHALNSKVWTALFEGYDPSSTKLQLEVRHPFVDVRLVEYLLAIPAAPWCVNKHILRLAMKDILPAAVVNRRKTPLGGDPALQLVRRASVRWLDRFEVSPQLKNFVDLNRRGSVVDEKTSEALWASLRVFALNHWLTNSQPIDCPTAYTRTQNRHFHDLVSLDCQKMETTHGT